MSLFTNLDSLPEELLHIITDNIMYEDLVSLEKTSHRLQLLFTDRQFWERKILALRPHLPTRFADYSLTALRNIYKNISTMGSVYMVGFNTEGGLGLGNVYQVTNPTKLGGIFHVIQVSCGYNFTALVTNEGKVYAFGDNANGQLGLGDTDNRYQPTKIPGIDNIIYVACGNNHTALVTDTGEVYTTGKNDQGQLGLGDTENRLVPTKISNLPKITQVSCGAHHTGFLTSGGNIYTCGSNLDGQLGLGNYDYRSVPDRVDILSIKQIVCSENCTALVSTEGKIYGCGINGIALCRGTRSPIFYPTLVPKFSNVIQATCLIWLVSCIEGQNSTDVVGSLYMCGVDTMIPDFPRPRNLIQIDGKGYEVAFITSEKEVYNFGIGFQAPPGTNSEKWGKIFKLPIDQALQVSCGERYLAIIAQR